MMIISGTTESSLQTLHFCQWYWVWIKISLLYHWSHPSELPRLDLCRRSLPSIAPRDQTNTGFLLWEAIWLTRFPYTSTAVSGSRGIRPSRYLTTVTIDLLSQLRFVRFSQNPCDLDQLVCGRLKSMVTVSASSLALSGSRPWPPTSHAARAKVVRVPSQILKWDAGSSVSSSWPRFCGRLKI